MVDEDPGWPLREHVAGVVIVVGEHLATGG
jgi:hypothetical protein